MSGRKRHRLTDEERQERITEAHARLSEAVDGLMTGDGWQAMITARAWLRHYSFYNLLMILHQYPNASDVRPLSEWNEHGRHVRKGENSIRIWAPRFRRATTSDHTDGAGGEETMDEAHRELCGFIPVPVFDVAQTEGEPVSAPPQPELLRGDAPARLWDQISEQIRTRGYQIERGDCGGANGYTKFADQIVRVRDDVEPAQAVKTLVHELAHIRCGHDSRKDVSRALGEVEAESVACIVTAVAGLDALPYSVPYVAGWACDRETVCASAKRVLAEADAILTELDLPAVNRAEPVHAEPERAAA